MQTSRRFATPFLIIVCIASSLTAAEKRKQVVAVVPDFTKGDKPPEGGPHDMTLGPTGLRGWIYAEKLETTLARQIYITQVDKESPAKVLRQGDVILGIDGKEFDSDARIAIGKAITEAEKEANQGKLRLLAWRAGKRATVELKLPIMGEYSATAPYNCPKSSRIYDQGCQSLAKQLRNVDSKKQVKAITRSLNAMALMASGKPEYLPLVRSEAQWAASFDIPNQNGFQSWHYGYVNTFLAEYVLATGDQSVMPGLRRLSLAIAKGQSKVGTWGHNWAYPETGTLEGYGCMNQPGLSLTISMILARKAGVQEPAVDMAIERSDLFLGFYIGKGCIPYGDHHPFMEMHDDNGKCGAGAVMFDLLGNAKGAEFFSRMCTASYGTERDTGHTGNFFNIYWAMPGVSRSGPQATGAWMKQSAWYYDLARRWDGTFLYQGEPGEKEAYDGWDCTGVYLLAYAMPLKKLYITGKKASAAPQLDAAAAKDIIADGRGWTPGGKSASYSERGLDELFTGLTSWSPIVRERSSIELARRNGDFVPRLISMLKGSDSNSRHGACQALAMLGKKGAPAVPLLRQTLGDEDLWLRVQAANALADIGAPARSTIPDLLKLAATVDKQADPRGMVQRYLSFSLFYNGGALKIHGLLSDSLQGADQQLLDQAVEAILQNQDGRARGAVGAVYKLLTYEEIKPLLPAVYKATVQQAPSGEMFASEIQLRGIELFAKYHIKEGIPLCLQVMEIDKWGKKKRITDCLKVLRSYGAAAKPMLPQLEQVAEHLQSHKEAKSLREQIDDVKRTIAAINAATDQPELRSLGSIKDRRINMQ